LNRSSERISNRLPLENSVRFIDDGMIETVNPLMPILSFRSGGVFDLKYETTQGFNTNLETCRKIPSPITMPWQMVRDPVIKGKN